MPHLFVSPHTVWKSSFHRIRIFKTRKVCATAPQQKSIIYNVDESEHLNFLFWNVKSSLLTDFSEWTRQIIWIQTYDKVLGQDWDIFLNYKNKVEMLREKVWKKRKVEILEKNS